MKRNLDLIRDILLCCEEDTAMRLTVEDIEAKIPYSFEEISYHVALLLDADFIAATEFPIMGSPFDSYIISRITMCGHDYLDSVRDDTIWHKTKKKLGVFLSSAPLSLISDVASAIIKAQLGI